MEKTIRIRGEEIDFIDGYLRYKGRPVIDVKELPHSYDELRFCDENKKPLPDSPRIICSPYRLE